MNMGMMARWWWRVRRGLRRIRGPYACWLVSRWETPVCDIDRLLPVTLCAQDKCLQVTVEASWEPGRPRWRVTFSKYQAYRNTDELHLNALWPWLNSSGQKCGSTFIVEHSPWIDELVDITPLRHYVLKTLDDVIEVASETNPKWEALGSAIGEPPLPATSNHLWAGEDNAEINQLFDEINRRQKPHQTG